MAQGFRNVHRIDGVATVFGLFGEDWGRIHELTQVRLEGAWMEAEACEPLRSGMTVCVGFQASGQIARRGTVEFCAPSRDGFTVRIRLDERSAA
jgi:hypothetical protein